MIKQAFAKARGQAEIAGIAARAKRDDLFYGSGAGKEGVYQEVEGGGADIGAFRAASAWLRPRRGQDLPLLMSGNLRGVSCAQKVRAKGSVR